MLTHTLQGTAGAHRTAGTVIKDHNPNTAHHQCPLSISHCSFSDRHPAWILHLAWLLMSLTFPCHCLPYREVFHDCHGCWEHPVSVWAIKMKCSFPPGSLRTGLSHFSNYCKHWIYNRALWSSCVSLCLPSSACIPLLFPCLTCQNSATDTLLHQFWIIQWAVNACAMWNSSLLTYLSPSLVSLNLFNWPRGLNLQVFSMIL